MDRMGILVTLPLQHRCDELKRTGIFRPELDPGSEQVKSKKTSAL
jgi:hypothetical protein